MDLIVSWVAFPVLLLGLCLGCGLLVAALARVAIPGALLPACGLAAIVIAGGGLTLADATAELTVPAVVGMALAGAWLGGRVALRRLDLVALVVAAVVLAVFAAPVVLSGEATIAGFIRLDDTATWLALTDRVIEHGRSLEGLAPSSYEATLAFNLGDGYPIGAFVPLGVSGSVLGTDIAWLIQPYIAVLAAILALSLWSLAGSLTEARSWRALAAILAAQSALLYGYGLWGGIKEVAAAMLIATAAALAGQASAASGGARRLVPLGLVAGALVGVLTAGALIWLAPILAGAALATVRARGRARAGRDALGFAAILTLAVLPALVSGGLLPPTSSPLTDDAAQGNLIGSLAIEQGVGIWPSGDFRLSPQAEPLVYALIAIAVSLAAVGIAAAIRARARGPLLYLAGSVAGCLVILALGSPWVDAKALATASPAIPFAAIAGAAWLARAISSPLGRLAAVAVAVGILWSNVLAYRDVNLAPRDQLLELERIGELIAGDGPALMTEYEPYGVRHFLRGADPEGISELRRREIPLREGRLVEKGFAADTDAIDPTALGIYRTLVLRRSPAQSRPPAAYELIWQGDSYEAWQRRAAPTTLGPRIALGGRHDPYAKPECGEVRTLAEQGGLVGARGSQRVIVPLSRASYPSAWATGGSRDSPRPEGAGTIAAAVEIARPGSYELWLEGSLRPAVETFVDGRPAGSVRHRLNNLGQYVSLGSARLDPGEHEVEIRIAGADLAPGSGGVADVVGPLVLSGGEAADTRLVRVDAASPERLCGREWDWIELAKQSGG